MPLNQYSRNGKESNDIFSNLDDKNQGLNFRYLLLLFWDNKFLIAAIAIICLLLSGAYAWMQPSIYESTGSVMVKKSQNQQTQGGSDLNSLLTSSYGIGTVNSVQDEKKLLQSRKLSLRTADTLQQVRLMQNGEQYPVLYSSYPDDSTLASREDIAKRLRNGLTFTSPEEEETNLLSLSYQSQSPLEAADVVNYTLNSYMELSTQQNRESADSAVKFLSNEKNRIQSKLYTAEQELQQYMNSSNLVQVDAQTQSMIEQTTTLQQQRQKARTNLVTANSAIEQYQERLNDIKPGLVDQFADAVGPNMTRLQYQLAELKTERRQMYSRNPGLDPENPPRKIREIDAQISNYENEIRTLTEKVLSEGDEYISLLSSEEGNIGQVVSGLQEKLIALKVNKKEYEAEVSALEDEIGTLDSDLENLPENMTQLARLKRNVKVNEELFLNVSNQHSEMSLWEETQFGQGQIMDDGFVPEEPIKPNKKLFLLIGLVCGLVLAGGIVLIKDKTNQVIDGTWQLDKFGVPLLAAIPNFNKYEEKDFHKNGKKFSDGNTIPKQMVSLLNVHSPTTDSIRRLESNILHSDLVNDLNALIVTSTRKGEGKTTVAANLGVIMAEADKKVIIVDTDLRRPNLHNMFGLERESGIVEVLRGDSAVSETVKSTMVKNLDVLTAGERSENASAVMKSENFKNLIENLKHHYDFVLLDTSPYGIITDFSSLIDVVDNVALLCRFGETKIGKLEHTFHSLNQIGANILGLILNDFDGEESTDNYYGNGYYEEIFEDYAEYKNI
jgi:capsular exopolysaccharide synthesis family protein